ncbi:MAG: hypothetical protein CM1200mP29_15840 [Verrucomicrobiota bacterium]|nr:MAG: hypothetical protein CM1200mP29_15840 [Verrucomicrobiota bacterium]
MAAEASWLALHEHARFIPRAACGMSCSPRASLVLKHVRPLCFPFGTGPDGVALLQPQAAGGLVNILACGSWQSTQVIAPRAPMMVRHGELAVCETWHLGRRSDLARFTMSVAKPVSTCLLPAPARFAAATEAQCTRCPIKTAVRAAGGNLPWIFSWHRDKPFLPKNVAPGIWAARPGGDRYAPGGGAGNEDGTGQGETEQCRKIQKPAQR